MIVTQIIQPDCGLTPAFVGDCFRRVRIVGILPLANRT